MNKWSNGALAALERGEKPIADFGRKDIDELIWLLVRSGVKIPYSQITIAGMKKWLGFYGECGYHHKFNAKNKGAHSIRFYSLERAVAVCGVEQGGADRFALLTWKEPKRWTSRPTKNNGDGGRQAPPKC